MQAEILIRPIKKEDANPMATLANNRCIWNQVRDRLPYPYTLQHAQNFIQHCQSLNPNQNFAIVYNNSFAGCCGFILNDDVYRKNIEIGYWIGEPYWGKGIATEAVKLICQYIKNNFDVVRIEANTFEGNEASMRVLQKNNFELEAIHKKGVVKNNLLLDEYVWVKMV